MSSLLNVKENTPKRVIDYRLLEQMTIHLRLRPECFIVKKHLYFGPVNTRAFNMMSSSLSFYSRGINSHKSRRKKKGGEHVNVWEKYGDKFKYKCRLNLLLYNGCFAYISNI